MNHPHHTDSTTITTTPMLTTHSCKHTGIRTSTVHQIQSTMSATHRPFYLLCVSRL